MASTYTDNNGIEKPGTGEQSGTWGDTVNTNMDLLDEALEGSVTVTLGAAGSSGSPNAFAISDGSTAPARHRFVTFSDGGDLGATAYVQLTPNDASKIYFAKNSLSASRALVLFQGTYNAGRAVQINTGETYLIAFDGGGTTAICTKIGEIPESTGTIAAQDANDVSITGGTMSGVTITSSPITTSSATITGGTITGITDITVADGGTGASDAATARANLGLAIGSNVQGWDTNLDQIAALTPTDSNFIVGNGSAWVAENADTALTSLGVTAAGKAILDDASASDQLTTLGVSTYAKTLLDDASAAAVQTTLGISAYAQTLLDDADATTARATLGVLTTSGSFSPSWLGGTSGTFDVTVPCYYSRNGSLVTVLGTVDLKRTAASPATGTYLYFASSSLPYTVANAPVYGSAEFYDTSANTWTAVRFTMSNNYTGSSLSRAQFALTNTAVATAPAAADYLRFSFHYITNAAI